MSGDDSWREQENDFICSFSKYLCSYLVLSIGRWESSGEPQSLQDREDVMQKRSAVVLTTQCMPWEEVEEAGGSWIHGFKKDV